MGSLHSVPFFSQFVGSYLHNKPPLKPVSYQVLKCLLKHLDPNSRFKISMSCPSIRKLEKSIHLYIKCLKLTDYYVTVNQDTYQLNVTNRKKDFQFDIGPTHHPDASEIEQYLNEIIIDNVRRYRAPEHEGELGDLSRLIEEMHADYLELVQRMGNRFRHLYGENTIRLIMGGRVEVLTYDRKMHEALKYLLGKLFGGRTVKVNRFAIGCATVIRIPSTVKFSVKILDLLDRNIHSKLEAVSLIIDGSSLPLNLVKFRIPKISVYNAEIDRSARMLEFQGFQNHIELASLHHKRVHATHFWIL